MTISSSTRDNAIITAPSAGSVSSPEKGGAVKAAMANISIIIPANLKNM
jgi:hypothetical protein